MKSRRQFLKYGLFLGLSLLSSSPAWAAPHARGAQPWSYDRFIRKDGHTFVQMPDGTLSPLLDLELMDMDRGLEAIEEARGEEVEVFSDGQVASSASSTPTSIDLSGYQTPIKNQQDRGTCWIFAVIAGVEARYKHDYGITLDLSEQFFNHAAKSTTLTYPKVYQYENQSSYWWGGGSWAVVSAQDYLTPLETYAPYLNQTQMTNLVKSIPEAAYLATIPAAETITQAQVDAFEYSTSYIPLSARYNAKYGVKSYTLYDESAVRNTTNLENILASKKEVIIDVVLNWKYNPTTGIYEHDPNAGGLGHCFLLVGYNRTGGYFLVKNSWGDSSFLKVAYKFFQNEALAGSVVESVFSPSSTPTPKGRFMGVWAKDHDGWKGKLVVRRTTAYNNAATRLGTYYDAYGAPHTFNGYSIDGGRGLLYHVPSEAENAPGTLSGQKFIVDQYSSLPEYASGTTWWSNIPFGVSLARTALNAPSSSSFSKSEWVGTWNMVHDGWKGKLYINSISSSNAISAYYVGSDGRSYSVSGSVNSTYNHMLTFTIGFSTPQSFTLHYHTRDDKLASGYTYWSGYRYGAHATK